MYKFIELEEKINKYKLFEHFTMYVAVDWFISAWIGKELEIL